MEAELELKPFYISGVDYESIADADGVATTIFFSGCNHHCDGCHSESTWDFSAGQLVTLTMIDEIAKNIVDRPFVKAIVLSGGDPVYSASEVYAFLDYLNIGIFERSNHNLSLDDFEIWLYTGFTVDQLIKMNDKNVRALLGCCNVIVDGPFEKDKRDITLNHRGSSNQHIYYILDHQDELVFAEYEKTKVWK